MGFRSREIKSNPGRQAMFGSTPVGRQRLSSSYPIPINIAYREQSRTCLYLFLEVAPEHFELTEYYQRYFRLNVVAGGTDADH